ncbi:MAG: queuine tRNA-ribosyltransferase family protein [Myxococcales bacterium]|nr:queuine tRNA-ribosyltransferase family protein [Myxococcales bacterium]MCB9717548.1 queuine tRNA-ribosyltransferase family protein [Myxococcales bacterium]
MEITTAHGPLRAPCYIPDATRGFVRSVDASDLEAVGIPGLMINAYHLMTRPGIRVVQRLGGLHAFAGWSGPIVTDSGGFQVFSLIRENPKHGQIRDHEVIFRPPDGRDKLVLTPEKVVQTQFRLGADVMVALDDCTGPEAPPDEQRRAVDRTVAWAKRAREEWQRQLAQRRSEGPPPILVAPVQGGNDAGLRRECAQALLDAGLTAFGFGGWPLDEEGALQLEMFALLHELLPATAPLFALGVGKPEHLVAITALGRPAVFDCSLPTRDARHHRLYSFRHALPDGPLTAGPGFYEKLYILDKKHATADEPISPSCDALCCRRYGRGYLHHLFRCEDPLALRLASLHNLRFYSQLCEHLREHGASPG